MQNVEHHCLSQEFPELKERIHDMKMRNAILKNCMMNTRNYPSKLKT